MLERWRQACPARLRPAERHDTKAQPMPLGSDRD